MPLIPALSGFETKNHNELLGAEFTKYMLNLYLAKNWECVGMIA